MSDSSEVERLVALAKGAKGAACRAVIEEALSAPAVYVFGELLDVPSIQQLAGTADAPWLQLLNLFAFGTYADYKAAAGSLPELNAQQVAKLRTLTIMTRAGESQVLTYADLMGVLDIHSLRELEDLIIHAIYAGLIGGKLDQSNQRLEVSFAAGRDIQASQLDKMAQTLTAWCDTCNGLLADLQEKIQYTEAQKRSGLESEETIAAKVDEIRKLLLEEDGSAATKPMDAVSMDIDAPIRQQRKRQALEPSLRTKNPARF